MLPWLFDQRLRTTVGNRGKPIGNPSWLTSAPALSRCTDHFLPTPHLDLACGLISIACHSTFHGSSSVRFAHLRHRRLHLSVFRITTYHNYYITIGHGPLLIYLGSQLNTLFFQVPIFSGPLQTEISTGPETCFVTSLSSISLTTADGDIEWLARLLPSS